MGLLANFKKNGKKLEAEVKETLTKKAGYDVDPRIFTPTRGADGNGIAIIRFLPSQHGDHLVNVITNEYKSPSTARTYREKSPQTIGLPDPASEYFSAQWKAGNQEEAKRVRRTVTSYANVYVLKDKAKPENEGKVMIYRFGQQIKNLIEDASKEKEEQITPVLNPFYCWAFPRGSSEDEMCAWTDEFGNPGANFVIRIYTKADFPSYEKSTFDWPTTLAPDEKLEEILSQTYDLKEFIAPEGFKSYEELKAEFDRCVGTTEARGATAAAPLVNTADVNPATGVDNASYERLQQLLNGAA
jgi:hypothetical protein